MIVVAMAGVIVTTKWDERFLGLARLIATWSKDPSTKVGAVVVRPNNTICSTGYNGFPRGLSDADYIYADRELKYARTVHAETNAILTAPERLDGYWLYCTLMPCGNCMLGVIQSGITRVICPLPPVELEERWGFRKTRDLAREAGVVLVEVPE